jgi:glycerophosphoryl diester phosphodiesterase
MLLIAHRTPPTASGCAELVAAGAGGFEVDVQLAGERVVVSHFLPFLRVRGWLEHDNWRFRWRAGPPHDTLLLDAIDLVPDGCMILLDPKETDPRRRAALADELARTLVDRDRFRVSTDQSDDLERYRAAGFGTWRTIKTSRDLHAVVAGPALPDQGVSVRHTLLAQASVAQLHRVVRTVVTWTVNNVDRAQQLNEFGVDGMTTDHAEVMSAVAG